MEERQDIDGQEATEEKQPGDNKPIEGQQPGDEKMVEWQKTITQAIIDTIESDDSPKIEDLKTVPLRDGGHEKMDGATVKQNDKHVFCAMLGDDESGGPAAQQVVVMGDPAKALCSVFLALKSDTSITKYIPKAMALADLLYAIRLRSQAEDLFDQAKELRRAAKKIDGIDAAVTENVAQRLEAEANEIKQRAGMEMASTVKNIKNILDSGVKIADIIGV